MVHKNLRGPFLVIAPLAVTPHWQREFESWTDELSVVKYADNQLARELIQEYELGWSRAMGCATPDELRKIKSMKGHLRPNVIVVAQDTFRQDIEFFTRFKWQCIVVDEAHTVRNEKSKYFQCIQALDAQHKIFLTGTPIQNHVRHTHQRAASTSIVVLVCACGCSLLISLSLPLSLLSARRVVHPPPSPPAAGVSGSRRVHVEVLAHAGVRRRRRRHQPAEGHPAILLSTNEVRRREIGQTRDTMTVERCDGATCHWLLTRRLIPFSLFARGQVPKREETLIEVELTTQQKSYYKAVFENNIDFLRGSTNKMKLTNIAMQLRQCCNHPYCIPGVEDKLLADAGIADTDTQAQMEKMLALSGKFVLLDKLLTKLQRQGQKVLIFSQFVKVLDLIEDFLNWRSWKYERLDGSTPARNRQQSIDRFSKPGSDRFVFMLSTRAGGVGITLVAAQTIIICQSRADGRREPVAQRVLSLGWSIGF